MQGHLVSNFISSHLTSHFLAHMASEKSKDNVKECLHNTYKQLFEELIKSEIDITFSGSTAITCYMAESKVYVANSGDSRAIIGTKLPAGSWMVKELSRDHKPELKEEYQRIKSKGGRVASCLDMDGLPAGPKRVWLKNEPLPGLAMSRSIGDLVAASVGVT